MTEKTFVQYSRAWYASGQPLGEGIADEVMLNIGQTFDFTVEWVELRKGDIAPRLRMFGDSFALFDVNSPMNDVWPMFARLQIECSPEQFCQALVERGFVDATPTTNPYQQRSPGPLTGLTKLAFSQSAASPEILLERALVVMESLRDKTALADKWDFAALASEAKTVIERDSLDNAVFGVYVRVLESLRDQDTFSAHWNFEDLIADIELRLGLTRMRKS